MENKSSRSNAKLAINVTDLQPASVFSLKGTTNSDDYVLIVEICGSFKVIPLSIKDTSFIDFDKDLFTSKISFELRDIKGNSFGVSEVSVPSNVMEKNEANIVDELSFASPKKEKELVKVKLSLTFSNTTKRMFKSTSKQSVEKKSSVSSTKRASTGKNSPTKRVENTYDNSNEKAFQDYLHNIITRESGKLKTIVDEHNSINEIVHLNKMHNNLPFSFGENTLHIYSPQKLSSRVEDDADVMPLQSVVGSRNSVPAITPIKKKPENGSRETSTEKRLATTGGMSLREDTTLDTRGNLTERKTSKTNLLDTSPPKGSPVSKRSKQDNPQQPMSARPRSPSPKKPQAQSQAQLQTYRDMQAAEKLASSRERKYKSQVEFLNQVIVNIEARLKKNDVMKQENSKLKEDSEIFYQEKKQLQESLTDAIAQFKEELVSLQKLNSNILNEKEQILKRNEELLNKEQKLEQVLIEAKLSMSQKENQVACLSAKVEELSNANQLIEGVHQALERSEQKRAEEQRAYTANLSRFEKSSEELQLIIQGLTAEKKELKAELQQARQELSEQKDANAQLKIDVLMLEKKLDYAEGFRSAVKSLEDQRDEMIERLGENKKALTQAEKLVEKVNKEFAEKMKEAEVRENQQKDEILALKESLKLLEIKNNQLSQDIVEIESKNRELSAIKCTFQKSEFLVESMRKERDEFKQKLDQAEEDKKILNQQIDNLAQNHKETNDKALDLEATIFQLQSNLKQSDSQIQSLCQLAEEVEDNENSIYVPQKNDPVDTALADFINTTQGSKGLKLLFVRECEGVYQFGSKKIYIKIEGDKILIRVGGGFLTIEEFIRQNGNQEYDRLAKNDPVKLLWRNIAINKVLVGKCVNCFDKSKTQAYTCG